MATTVKPPPKTGINRLHLELALSVTTMGKELPHTLPATRTLHKLWTGKTLEEQLSLSALDQDRPGPQVPPPWENFFSFLAWWPKTDVASTTSEEPRVTVRVRGKSLSSWIYLWVTLLVVPAYSGKTYRTQITVMGAVNLPQKPRATGPLLWSLWGPVTAHYFLVMSNCPTPLLAGTSWLHDTFLFVFLSNSFQSIPSPSSLSRAFLSTSWH